MTMTFRGDRVGTVFNALTNRGDSTSGLTAPIPQACRSRSLVAVLVLATQLTGL